MEKRRDGRLSVQSVELLLWHELDISFVLHWGESLDGHGMDAMGTWR